MTGIQELSFFDLAAEIERRRLKFADVVDGHYEMLSEVEHEAVVTALRVEAKLLGERE